MRLRQVKITRTYLLAVLLLVVVSCSRLDLIPPQGLEVFVEADTVVFAQIGDFGLAGDAEFQVSELVKSWQTDFIITTGDNNYPDGKLSTIKQNISQYYGDYIYNYDAPEEYRCNGQAFDEGVNRFFPSPGNHDGYNRNGIVPYLNFFTLPGIERYYKFTWGPVTFFSLNSYNDNLPEQKTWLEEQILLAGTPFKVVYFHHPPYSEGPHGNFGAMQWDFHSMGIDVVFCGHDHTYNKIVKKGEEGTYYIVNGLGGKSLNNCKAIPLPTDTYETFCYNSDYGAVKVCANYHKMLIEFFAVGSPKQAVDSVIIEK